jgi:2-amino-4-hydroxy-6-hydroxymethyldihydropteridine diphosphokinase
MAQVVLTLGSNIDKETNLPAAVRLLAARATVTAVSSVYETLAAGLHEQPNFFNAAVLIETDESPAELKDSLLSDIERELKRQRLADKNAPRTIDLDIALYGDQILEYTPADGRTRHIPDRDLLRFAHCTLPVAEILPEMLHPETGQPLKAIASRVLQNSSRQEKPTIWRRTDFDLRSLVVGASRPVNHQKD